MNKDLEKFQKMARRYSRDMQSMISLIEDTVSVTEMEMVITSILNTLKRRQSELKIIGQLERMQTEREGRSPFTGISKEEMKRGIDNVVVRALEKFVESMGRAEETDSTVTEDEILNMFKKMNEDG